MATAATATPVQPAALGAAANPETQQNGRDDDDHGPRGGLHAHGQPGDDVRGMSGFTCLGHLLYRRIGRGRKVIGDEHQGQRHHQAQKRGDEITDARDPADAVHHVGGHGKEGDCGQTAADEQAFVQGRHDTAAFARLHEEDPDNGGKDGHPAEGQGIQYRSHVAGEETHGQHHGRDDGHDVGFEQVGGHPGAVADVVTHVVRDHRGVAGVVFGDPGFDFSDEVGSHVRGFGVNASAHPGKDRNQAAAEPETDEGVYGFFRPRYRGPDGVKTRQGHEAQPDKQQSGHRAAFEGDLQCRVQPVGRGLRRPDVRSHGNHHAHVPGDGRSRGAHHEPHGRQQPEIVRPHPGQPQNQEHDACHDADGSILSIQIRAGAFLDRQRDGLHGVVTGVLSQDPEGEIDPIGNAHDTGH